MREHGWRPSDLAFGRRDRFRRFRLCSGRGKRLKFPQVGQVRIGNDVEIGANTTIDRGSLDRTDISAGVNSIILVHVAHNVQIGENTVIARKQAFQGPVVIGRDVIFWGPGGKWRPLRIEDGAVIGAQAGIPSGKTIRSVRSFGGLPRGLCKNLRNNSPGGDACPN